MAEFQEISEKAIEIINHFFGQNGVDVFLARETFHMDDVDGFIPTYEEFVVSLYAMTPDADSEILKALEEYRIDFPHLSDDEKDVLLKEYRAVIRYCTDSDFIWWPSKTLTHTLPSELVDLCHTIVKDYCRPAVVPHPIFNSNMQFIQSESDVYLPIAGDVLFPFADDAQFGQNLSECSFDAYEADSKLWAFSQILRDAYSMDTKIQVGSSSENSEGKLYDYVFSCPMGRKDARSIAGELYDIAATRLRDNGVMCCILPESFCHASEWYGFRKILIDGRGQYSALVVSLPGLLQPYVAENICLFCLIKPKRDEAIDESIIRMYGMNDGDIIVKMDGEIIADENGMTKDVELREKWLKSKMDDIVLINAKSNDFLEYRQMESCFLPTISERSYVYQYHFSYQSMLEELGLFSEEGIRSDIGEKHICRRIPLDLSDDLNLLPSRYIGHYYERGVRLGDIIELVTLADHKSPDDGEKICGVEFAGLSSNYLNCDISYKCEPKTKKWWRGLGRKPYSKTLGDAYGDEVSLKEMLANAFNYEPDRLAEECLLASYFDGRFKVGRIIESSASCPYVLSSEVIPFRVKSDLISADYLLMTLMSDEVAEQARMLSWGGFYNCIDKEDFLQIEIPLHSKEEQEKLFREDVQKSLEKADRKLQESNEEFRRDMHMKKHAIGQTIFAFGGWWDVLQQARRENGGTISDDTVVGKLRQVTVSEIYDNLRKTFDRLQQQIYKMDRGNGLKKEDFALTTFIEEYVKDNGRSEFEFEYNAGKHHRHNNVLADDRIVEGETEAYRQNHRDWNSGNGEPIEYVYFSKEALKIVLDNIVSNACSHGFTDPDAKNIIKIEVSEDPEDDNAFLIRVSNNGKPIDEKRFPLENVFIYGSSSASGDGEHFGLGGYEVKHLMWEFGGDAKLIPTPPDEGFTVCYELKLPKGKEVSYKKNA